MAIHGFPCGSALTSANIAPVKLAWDHQTALIIPNGAHYGQSTSGLLVNRPQSARLPTSNSQAASEGMSKLIPHPRFELARPIARNRQIRVFEIFQTNIQSSPRERRDFLDPVHIDHCAPVDTEEFLGIQFSL
jgi:hypothetical protein